MRGWKEIDRQVKDAVGLAAFHELRETRAKFHHQILGFLEALRIERHRVTEKNAFTHRRLTQRLFAEIKHLLMDAGDGAAGNVVRREKAFAGTLDRAVAR